MTNSFLRSVVPPVNVVQGVFAATGDNIEVTPMRPLKGEAIQGRIDLEPLSGIKKSP